MNQMSGVIHRDQGTLLLRCVLMLALLCGCAVPVRAATQPPRPTAFFGFVLDDTSLQGEMKGRDPDDTRRLSLLSSALQDALVRAGCMPVDLSPIAGRIAAQNLRACGGCEVDLARSVGAQIAVNGWVQKVSNLILNINVVVRDVATGSVMDSGSVDIRGNTDESWLRGVAFLVRDRLRPNTW